MRPVLGVHLALACGLIAALALPRTAAACTNILVAKGAAVDDATYITYSADSHELYGDLRLRPAGKHAAGAKRVIIEWDTGKRLGEIDEAPETYAVVGNINEHQVSIGETTFTGREELIDPEGIIDYGSLMMLALERGKTARQAMLVMTDLVARYGYASSGETFSIADPNETWIMEMIGKGPKGKGAVWVARRLPDGHISAHANHSRITQFPLDDPKNTLYSKDVISFARAKGWFQGDDKDFSFADAYAPTDFGALRFCEARVFSVFNRAAPSLKIKSDLVKGSLKADAKIERLPLWIKPDKKLALRDVMALMRDHYEGTAFDMTKDVGAGPFVLPYRWRPMQWELDGKTYLHERAISTQQTGFSFVAQMRGKLPAPIGGVLWFGLDDTYLTVYVPMWAGIRRAPPSFAPEAGNFDRFSWGSAFWTFNFVSNWVYTRYRDMIQDVQVVQDELEGRFIAEQAEVEAAAIALYKQSPALARDFLTERAVAYGEETTTRWRQLGEFLLWKYLDGNVRDAQGHVTHPRYPDAWYQRIIRDAGDRIRMPDPEKKP